VVRRIFGHKMEEISRGWERLPNEELHNLHTSPNIIRMFMSRKMRWLGHVTHVGEMRNADKILVKKPEEERPHRRSRHRWGNILEWIFRI